MAFLRLSLQQPVALASPFQTGLLYGMLSAFCFGLMALFVQVGGAVYSPTQLLFYRALFSFLLITPVCWRELSEVMNPQAWRLWFRACFAGVSVRVLFFNCSTIGASNATLLLDSAIVFMVLIAWLLLKERIRPLEWICIFLVLGASILLSLPAPGTNDPIAMWQIALGLGGALCAAISFLTLKKVSHQYSQASILWVYALVLMLASCLPPQPTAWAEPTFASLPIILGVGLSSVLNQLYLTQSYKLCKASIAGMISLTGVLWATLFEAVAFQQWPSPLEWLALTLMLGGVGLLKWGRANE